MFSIYTSRKEANKFRSNAFSRAEILLPGTKLESISIAKSCNEDKPLVSHAPDQKINNKTINIHHDSKGLFFSSIWIGKASNRNVKHQEAFHFSFMINGIYVD